MFDDPNTRYIMQILTCFIRCYDIGGDDIGGIFKNDIGGLRH
jgi:hypothetical protein